MDESSSASDKTVSDDTQALKDSAFRLLTRREHSRFELRQKLVKKGWSSAAVAELLDWLQAEGWQSDERFAQSFVRDKLTQGQGRLKIVAQATQQRGVARELVEAVLEQQQPDWRSRCRAAHQKKFGDSAPEDRKQWAKRVRYLQQKGFNGDEIFAVLGELER